MADNELTEPLYDADILLWSEQQAELLRRRSANALDWDNLAEEIKDVGPGSIGGAKTGLLMPPAPRWPPQRSAPWSRK